MRVRACVRTCMCVCKPCVRMGQYVCVCVYARACARTRTQVRVLITHENNRKTQTYEHRNFRCRNETDQKKTPKTSRNRNAPPVPSQRRLGTGTEINVYTGLNTVHTMFMIKFHGNITHTLTSPLWRAGMFRSSPALTETTVTISFDPRPSVAPAQVFPRFRSLSAGKRVLDGPVFDVLGAPPIPTKSEDEGNINSS